MQIFDLPGTRFQMAMADVPDTTSVITEPCGHVHTRQVPGTRTGESYVSWGADDQLPYDLISLIGADEVTAQNKLFNVLTCYGAGPQLISSTATPSPLGRDGEGLPVAGLAEAQAWADRNDLPSYCLEQITDMKHFYFTVSVIILSRDGTRINRIVHKEACHCRLAPADRYGRIPYIYYANWRWGSPAPDGVERIPLLNITDPLGDLMRRMGREPWDDGRLHPAARQRKYAIITRFPTAGCQYYPVPYWTAMLRGGSYDEKRLISIAKRAKLRNHASVKYQVEVERGYWERICREEYITDPVKMQERVTLEKEHIRDFVAGIENAGKVWISSYYVDPDGHEVRDVRITRIDTAKEGGDWADDVQAAANTVCYADNIHPNLVGATPGKSQMNNSGSDKRELFTMKQALETAFHDMLLRPLRLVMAYNGWHGVRPALPMIQLTTLDQHKDAETVTSDK